MSGSADKFMQSAQARLLWPGHDGEITLPYVLKKLFAASFEARFLVMATCSRSISDVSSAIRSVNSRSESMSDRYQPYMLLRIAGG